jgi:hypothetical protein
VIVATALSLLLVGHEAPHVVVAQPRAAVEKGRLDHEGASCHFGARLLNQATQRLRRAARGQQVVVEDGPGLGKSGMSLM